MEASTTERPPSEPLIFEQPAPLGLHGARQMQKLVSDHDKLGRLVAEARNMIVRMADKEGGSLERGDIRSLETSLRDLIDTQDRLTSLNKHVLEVSEKRREHVETDDPSDVHDPTEGDGTRTSNQNNKRNASKLLSDQIELARQAYLDKTPLQRFGGDRDFKKFKDYIWDHEHPNEDPPAIATYFPAVRNADAQEQDDALAAGSQGMPAGDGDADEDLHMTYAPGARSLKCPITCVTFVDPVKSKVCSGHHSFERSAILQMIRSHGVTELSRMQEAGLVGRDGRPNMQHILWLTQRGAGGAGGGSSGSDMTDGRTSSAGSARPGSRGRRNGGARGGRSRVIELEVDVPDSQIQLATQLQTLMASQEPADAEEFGDVVPATAADGDSATALPRNGNQRSNARDNAPLTLAQQRVLAKVTIECPMTGCASRIGEEDLEDDYLMARRVRQALQQDASGVRRTHSGALVDDGVDNDNDGHSSAAATSRDQPPLLE
ncbi:hypothetical protein PYCC9005_004015 [Savitreella phatthalungensis]